MAEAPVAEVGVFGGSGFYRFLDDVTEVTVETPHGPTSAPVAIGRVGERRVAFIPRHGAHHELPPHLLPYRANVWALHALGVTNVFGPCASGSLQPHVAPGSFVVPDQLVDRTSGRADTFFDGPTVHHVAFADPYDHDLRQVALAACRAEGVEVHDGGTVVVVQGPRFSTRAESRWYGGQGWEVINMTQHPEAVLCREAGLRYAAIALITDFDAGLEGSGVPAVTQEEVFAFFEANVDTVRRVLFRALAAPLPTGRLEAGPGF
ncbi:S-methyl-5'-thioadenosine phosphorylase [Aquihabitans sp. G128]|uniref:S-methyl-5'-thioadenosine phosphorylase n=1 Tax=Aquihabitans sp. G128 TaxID=2849779 RepID=UPI0020B32CEB|nr:S-methyl-5'-thioadenosine phosphorylase [Aquihabitans sp. G128]